MSYMQSPSLAVWVKNRSQFMVYLLFLKILSITNDFNKMVQKPCTDLTLQVTITVPQLGHSSNIDSFISTSDTRITSKLGGMVH